MCGIVGAVSRVDVTPFLLKGLQRLEYRGYDSAGVVVINDAAVSYTHLTLPTRDLV